VKAQSRVGCDQLHRGQATDPLTRDQLHRGQATDPLTRCISTGVSSASVVVILMFFCAFTWSAAQVCQAWWLWCMLFLRVHLHGFHSGCRVDSESHALEGYTGSVAG